MKNCLVHIMSSIYQFVGWIADEKLIRGNNEDYSTRAPRRQDITVAITWS